MTVHTRPRLLRSGGVGGTGKPKRTTLIEKHAVLVVSGPKTQGIPLDNPVDDGDYVAVILQGIGYTTQCTVSGLNAAWKKTHNNSSYFSENSDQGTLWEAIVPPGGTVIDVTTPSGGVGAVAVFIYVFRRPANSPVGLDPLSPFIQQITNPNGHVVIPPITSVAAEQVTYSTAVGESQPQTTLSRSPSGDWDTPLNMPGLPPGGGGGTQSWAAATFRVTQQALEVNQVVWIGGVRSAGTTYMMAAPIPV